MNIVSKTDALMTLIKAVQTRLWFEKTLQHSITALWGSAFLLLLLGLINIFWIPLSNGLTLFLPLTPLVLIPFFIIRSHPNLALAAKTGDHWFNGQSLLSSAVEITQKEKKLTPAQMLVLHQAEQASIQWRSLLKNPQRSSLPTGSSILLVALISGVSLILLPSYLPDTLLLKEKTNNDLLTSENSLIETKKIITEINPPHKQDFALLLRQSLQQNKTQISSENNATLIKKSELKANHNLPLLELDVPTNEQQLISTHAEPIAKIPSANTQGELAGTAPPAPDKQKQHYSKTMKFNSKTSLEIKLLTTADPKIKSGAGVSTLNNFAPAALSEKHIDRTHTGKTKIKNIYYSHLPPALNHYIGRYLHALNTNGKNQTGGIQP